MKNVTIENEFLHVEISPLGAEMQSVKGKDGTEYLWQGEEHTWPDRAINLFPYIGRLTNGTYRYQGREYQMKIHGFVPYSELETAEQKKSSVKFLLTSNEETQAVYPFTFCYSIEYALEGSEIRITFRVVNQGEKTMYFGIGGHPGFQVPIGGEGAFEEYYLEFAEAKEVRRVTFSDSCFVTGEEPLLLEDGVRLPLRHDLFDNDAIVFRNMSKRVAIKSDKTDRSVTVEYPQMEYLGIWHWPKTEVNYVCIEPWSSLPSGHGIVEDIETQKDLVKLEAGKTYENRWTIRIGQQEKR